MSLLSKVKDSNPKDTIGIQKTPFSTLSEPVIAEIGVAMLEGALKYGRHNYREIGVRTSVYYDAARRHLAAFWEGEDIDPDSGMPHIIKAMATLMVLRDAQIRDKVYDDRPVGTSGFIQALNQKTRQLLEMFPEPKEPFISNRESDVYHAS